MGWISPRKDLSRRLGWVGLISFVIWQYGTILQGEGRWSLGKDLEMEIVFAEEVDCKVSLAKG